MPKKELAAGDQGRALCRHCRAVMLLTYQYRSVALDADDQAVPHVLAGVCNFCDRVVALAPQATADIKRARLAARHSVVALVPHAVLETLERAAASVDRDALPDFPKRLLLHYVEEFAGGRRDLHRFDAARHWALAQFAQTGQQPLKRYSMVVTAGQAAAFAALRGSTWLNTTMLLKCLVADIALDLLEEPTADRLAALRAWCDGRTAAGPTPPNATSSLPRRTRAN